jgi:hypothetical protein
MLVHRRFEIGRRAHQLDRLCVVTLHMGQGSRRPQALDFDLVGP